MNKINDLFEKIKTTLQDPEIDTDQKNIIILNNNIKKFTELGVFYLLKQELALQELALKYENVMNNILGVLVNLLNSNPSDENYKKVVSFLNEKQNEILAMYKKPDGKNIEKFNKMLIDLTDLKSQLKQLRQDIMAVTDKKINNDDLNLITYNNIKKTIYNLTPLVKEIFIDNLKDTNFTEYTNFIKKYVEEIKTFESLAKAIDIADLFCDFYIKRIKTELKKESKEPAVEPEAEPESKSVYGTPRLTPPRPTKVEPEAEAEPESKSVYGTPKLTPPRPPPSTGLTTKPEPEAEPEAEADPEAEAEDPAVLLAMENKINNTIIKMYNKIKIHDEKKGENALKNSILQDTDYKTLFNDIINYQEKANKIYFELNDLVDFQKKLSGKKNEFIDFFDKIYKMFNDKSPPKPKPEPTSTGEPKPKPTSTGEPKPEPTSTGEPKPKPTSTGEPKPESTTESGLGSGSGSGSEPTKPPKPESESTTGSTGSTEGPPAPATESGLGSGSGSGSEPTKPSKPRKTKLESKSAQVPSTTGPNPSKPGPSSVPLTTRPKPESNADNGQHVKIRKDLKNKYNHILKHNYDIFRLHFALNQALYNSDFTPYLGNMNINIKNRNRM
jgi:hypothetical protein